MKKLTVQVRVLLDDVEMSEGTLVTVVWSEVTKNDANTIVEDCLSMAWRLWDKLPYV